MTVLGITGGIGSGKSVVSQLLSLNGISVYIADTESKRLVSTSPAIREKLIHLFGEEIYAGGVLNKPFLASYIFNDKKVLETVNAIIHPEVGKDFQQWLQLHNRYDIVAQESAILFESGFNRLVDKVIMVYTPLEIRIRRVMERDNITRDKVLERIQSQMTDEEKVKLSDFVIVNDGTKSLIGEVFNILQQIKEN
jgi:dephospho-CoA kinase